MFRWPARNRPGQAHLRPIRKAVPVRVMEAPDMDADTPQLKPNPAQEEFDKTQAKRVIDRDRKNAAREARPNIQASETSGMGRPQS